MDANTVINKPAKFDNMRQRYERAQLLEQGAFTKRVAFNTTLYPHWIGDSDCFWYIRDLQGGGSEYRLVDARTKSNKPAFDHQVLAETLTKATGHVSKMDKLPITDIKIDLSPSQVTFTAYGSQWIYDENAKTCRRTEAYPHDWKISPDGKKAMFTRDSNLWVRHLESGEEKALTNDGKQFYVYANTPTVYGRQEAPSLEAIWSPDSKRIFTVVIDTRNVKTGPPLVQHVPTDGSLRPKIKNADRKVAFAEDEYIEVYRFLSIQVDTAEVQMADYPTSPVCYPPYVGFFSGYRGWWAGDSRRAYFIDQLRDGKIGRLVEFDTHTGTIRVLIEEQSDTGINFIPTSHVCTLLLPMPDTDELIWYSQRSGWAHLYLYDLKTSELKNTITQGEWLVRNVLHLDITRRELFVQTACSTTGRNPYYCDICRVNIDTGELKTLLSTDDDYIVCDGRNRVSHLVSQARGVSPSGNYIVTTRSRVNTIPVSLLLDRDGNELLEVETADVSGLPKGWQWPEPVMLKAEDGRTDTYGVIFRPSDFSPDKSYPVLDCSYAGCAPVGSFTNNNASDWHYMMAAAWAELGFIVVMIGNRGNSNLRDQAFNTYVDPVLQLDPRVRAGYNQADCVAGIRQLAEQFRYMDLDRVGVAEFGSVPTAVAGLLVHPDFYKVGVSLNPGADLRLAGALGMQTELDDSPVLEDFAHNLRGKLLLTAGMLDDVLPVAMTFRIVESLQKANRTFDMLVLPNLGHGGSGYTRRRAWDYMVQHLMGAEPPDEFELKTSVELMMQELESETDE